MVNVPAGIRIISYSVGPKIVGGFSAIAEEFSRSKDKQNIGFPQRSKCQMGLDCSLFVFLFTLYGIHFIIYVFYKVVLLLFRGVCTCRKDYCFVLVLVLVWEVG